MTADNEAQQIFKKALEDIKVLDKLIDDFDVADETWGFHAQQAIEKLLKSVLFKNKIEFPRTHDLGYLAGLLQDSGLKLPVSIDDIEFLNPFGVTLRYDDVADADKIDRPQIRNLVQNIFNWVESEIKK